MDNDHTPKKKTALASVSMDKITTLLAVIEDFLVTMDFTNLESDILITMLGGRQQIQMMEAYCKHRNIGKINDLINTNRGN